MDSIKFKPLGSVISINGSEKRFMIIARALSIRTRDGKTAFFDYGAVMYPEGLIGKNIIYFQDKDIREVVFEGFDDPENAQLMERVAERLKRVNVQHVMIGSEQQERVFQIHILLPTSILLPPIL